MSEKGRFWLQRQLFTVHGVSMASMETISEKLRYKRIGVYLGIQRGGESLPASGLGCHDNAAFPIHRRT